MQCKSQQNLHSQRGEHDTADHDAWHRDTPVMMASGSLSFQCFATLSASGSSGFGALSSAWMLQHTHAGLADAVGDGK